MTAIAAPENGTPGPEDAGSRLAPMLNERVAFVGSFIEPSKDDLEAFVTEYGGKSQNFVNAATTLVVAGSYHTPPVKLLRADELNQGGAGIRIMSAEDFIKETDSLSKPLVTDKTATRIEPILFETVVDPEIVDGEQVFQTRRAKRDYERMTEALAILQIDETTGRAYHGAPSDESVPETKQSKPEPGSPVVMQTVSVASEPVAAVLKRERPAKRTRRNDIYAGFGEKGAGFGFKLWMIPVLSFFVLSASIITDSKFMTFASVATTMSSILLLFLAYVARRGLWKTD